MQYDKIKIAVGIFVLLLLTIIFATVFFILKEKGTFQKRYSYNFYTKSAASFNVGMPLKFSGFKIGVIDNIALENNGEVHMVFSVSEENRKWIAKGTTLTIKKPLIGSAHIEVHSIVGNEPLPAGATLKIFMSDDINDMISKLEPVVNKLINIIDNIDIITTKLAGKNSDMMQTLKNINLFSQKLVQNDSLLTTFTGDKNITKDLITSIKTTNNILNNIETITNDVKKTTASLDDTIIHPITSSIHQIQIILKDIQSKLKTLPKKDIIHFKKQISITLEKSNQIMDRIDTILQDNKNSEVKLP